MNRQSTRREFVQQAATGTIAGTLVAGLGAGLGDPLVSRSAKVAAAEAKQTMNSLPIVDTHQHLWDLNRFRLPWLRGVPALARSYVTSDYLAAADGLNVVKAVYMEVDVDPTQQVAEAEHLIELCRDPKTLTVGAVISGRPGSDAFRGYITRFRDNSVIKGVRQVLHVPETPAGTCVGKQFVSSVQWLGELGMSFDLCMRPGELGDAVKLADRCPDTRLIVDHCGNADPKAFRPKPQGDTPDSPPKHDPDQWRRDMVELAKRKNTICKISGIVASAPKGNWTPDDLAPIINHCLDTFGMDRVVFGSDWPVCTLAATYRQWVTALKQIISNRPEADQRKLLHDNAVRYYRL